MDTTNVVAPTNDQTAKPAKRAPQSQRIEHSKAIADYAKLKGIDTTRAGKMFRSKLRANFATVAKADAKNYGPKGKIKRHANDRTPWGSHSRKVLQDLGLAK